MKKAVKEKKTTIEKTEKKIDILRENLLKVKSKKQ